MIEAARYFEAIPATMDRQTHFDRAVILYSKAGLLDTALDLASRLLFNFHSFYDF